MVVDESFHPFSLVVGFSLVVVVVRQEMRDVRLRTYDLDVGRRT